MKLNKKKIGTSKAAGEALVCYMLARHGWLPVNVNGGVSNMPNIDLIAFRDGKQVNIQVKAAVGKDWTMFAGRAKDNHGYFNSKPGPKADYAVCVSLEPNSVAAICYVMPVRVAERLARREVRLHMQKPKKGKQGRAAKRSLNFPVWIKNAKLKVWREKWDALG